MTSNVLPLFWHLASSSRDTRLSATADLVSAVTAFQATHSTAPTQEPGSEDEDDEDDSDAESGMEVDESDDGEERLISAEDAELDAKFVRDNHPDVAYTVKRLVRGLSSSRESSRLGFAVALTEVRRFIHVHADTRFSLAYRQYRLRRSCLA